jgi:hypothetical protein
MTITYMQAIGLNWPNVQCHAQGSGAVYEDIVWESGEALPSKEVLDAWIATHPEGIPLTEVTRYQFRKLFTLNERIAVDNAPANVNIPAQYRAALVTVLKDLELSGVVYLDNPDIQAGLELLVAVGLLQASRVPQILSNTPPATVGV